MTTTAFHPAIVRLLRLQGRGRGRRMWRRFCQTRRLVLSAVACVLTVVWLGNAAMTIWFRESASPETLRALLSLGLALYAGWHFAKAAFFRPESPLDWTPVERELLVAMPLGPRDLVAYQLASTTLATLLKATLFTLLLLPDLRSVPLGLIGVVLVMMTLEMFRMAIDIVTWGMSRSAFLAYRTAVVAGLVAGGFAVGNAIVREATFGSGINVGEGLLQRLLDILVQLNASVFGFAALPFQPFLDLILADTLTATEVGLAGTALATMTGLAAAVIGLYAAITRRVVLRENRNYRAKSEASDSFAGSTQTEAGSTLGAVFELRLRRVPRWGGAGALAWRQLVGARRHWGNLLTAMIAPAVIAWIPVFVIADAAIAFLATTGTLAFYTFLLLPTALRFDFRRDLDRLATLKCLPITPSAAVLGQLLAPLLIVTLFQFGVLAFAIVVLGLPPHHLFTAILVLIPLNVLVFALDNFIFLLYPYRVQQEGLEIFFRTMLTFTGKGLLFTAGLTAMAGWGLVAASLTDGISITTGIALDAHAVFAGGLVAGPSLLASLTLYGLCRTYGKLNPIEDLPQ